VRELFFQNECHRIPRLFEKGPEWALRSTRCTPARYALPAEQCISAVSLDAAANDTFRPSDVVSADLKLGPLRDSPARVARLPST